MGTLFLAFTLVPLLELFLLVRIGRVLGPGSTLLLVLASAILGAVLAKSQGRKVLEEWRESLAAGRVPEEGVLGGVLVFLGGVLLITPGVLTDVAGQFCLLPATRRMIARALHRHLAGRFAQGVQVQGYGVGWPPGPPRSPGQPPRPIRRDDVIDTEGEEV